MAAAGFQRGATRQTQEMPWAQHVDAASREVEVAAQISKKLADGAVRGRGGAFEDHVERVRATGAGQVSGGR